MTDLMTRAVNKAAGYAVNDTAITFDTPERALIPGEAVTFAGHATVYDVKSSTSTVVVLNSGLTTTVADNVQITRQDRYAIASIEDIADALGRENVIGNETEKTWLYKLALSGRKSFEQEFIGGPVVTRSYTEVLSASDRYDIENGSNVFKKNLQLAHFPIVSVSSVTVDDDAVDSDEYEIQSDLGILYRASGWPTGNFHISVTYTAGFEIIPEDIRQYYFDWMQFLLAKSHRGEGMLIRSQSQGFSEPVVSVTYRDMNEIKTHIMNGLRQYRRMRVM